LCIIIHHAKNSFRYSNISSDPYFINHHLSLQDRFLFFRQQQKNWSLAPCKECMIEIKQDSQCTYKRNNVARNCNLCCSGKAISITHSEYVCVALVIQHEMRIRCIILSSVAYPVPPYFSTLSHKGCVALVTQHEMRICCIILSSVACPVPPYFPTLSHNGATF